MAPSALWSEELIGQQWDRCFSDSLIKLGTGFGLGAVFSLVLFKRRKWPLLVGSGIGLGIGLANCQHAVNAAFTGKNVNPQSQTTSHE